MPQFHALALVIRHALIAALLVCAAAPPVRAERLPSRWYGTVDGLAGDYVLGVFQDSRGFLWFSTRDGVSRFDGVRFVNYGTAHGLPTATINTVLETRDGRIWLGTNGGGVALFNPHGGQKLFTSFRIAEGTTFNRVNVLFEDRGGRLWAGTDEGLYRREDDRGTIVFKRYPLPVKPPRGHEGIGTIAEDHEGSLWLTGSYGLYRILPDGRVVIYSVEPSIQPEFATGVSFDAAGRAWIGFSIGLYVHNVQPASSFTDDVNPILRAFPRQGRGADRWFTTEDGIPDRIVTTVYRDSSGDLWIGTAHGVAVMNSQGVIRRIGPQQGVRDAAITRIVDDSAGSIWIASVNGVTRLVRHGLVTYDVDDGLGNTRIHSLALDRDSRLIVVTGEFQISEFQGNRFQTRRPPELPDTSCGWMSRCGMIDRAGDLWLSAPSGLHRWIGLRSVADLATHKADFRYGKDRGLPEDWAFAAFEDRDGNVWVGTAFGAVARWMRTSNSWETYDEADGLPPLRRSYSRLTAFAQDRSGAAWLGFDGGGLARLRGGRFEQFTVDHGVPPGNITSLLLDSAGKLWIASTEGGLGKIADPLSARPQFETFTTARGLSSDNVRCLVEDRRGRIYAGTTRGITRLDPATGALKRYSTREGLASDFVTTALRDPQGRLWFGTLNGLSRLDVVEDGLAPTTSPAVFIGSVTVAGAPSRLSELGEVTPAALTLAPDQNQLEIEFFGFSFESGAPLRYQYRLDNVQTAWSPPSELRSINYARLSPGAYRFLVRAVRADGTVSAAPASMAFTVLPPFYARWWFITLAAAGLAALAIMLYRARVAQLLRVERVRARIATDLHDDIGASLSQIAILAEVARERMNHPPGDDAGGEAAAAPLARIAETSRGLVDSMSDIVWAINPEVDSLSDLVHRMRRFVEDTLGASDIEVIFRAPDPSADLRLGADLRREIFLILKESVTNIAKHATATRVGIDFESSGRRLWLRVADNGRGFDPAAGTDGNGVASMRRRVSAVGGRLTIESAPGRGTTITLDIDRRTQ